MEPKYDFSGWATRNDIRCADGRTIRRNAFIDDDAKTVPLVWQHKHDDPSNVLGHALLENRDDGVYAYCKFNTSEKAKTTKELIKHGDISTLSIWANGLKQNGRDVLHGCIREVSVVLAGANPGAYIDVPEMIHGDLYDEVLDADDFEATIYSGEGILVHAADANEEENTMANQPAAQQNTGDNRTVEDIVNSMDADQKKVLYYLIGKAAEGNNAAPAQNEAPAQNNQNIAHDAMKKDDAAKKSTVPDDATVGEVLDTFTEDQKKVLYFLIAKAVEDAKGGKTTKNDEGESEMKHNAFESDNTNYLSHDDMVDIFSDAKRIGSLREACLQHGIEDVSLAHDGLGDAPKYGITNVSELYPEYHNLNTPPEFITRNMDWVSVVMNGVHKTPFARIKSMWANLTEDEARAKGYIKGKIKKEQFFSVMKRTTSPTTIYKKQKMDRDDLIDVTDFDVVSWLKQEMKFMLDEEQARAILVGDGRNPSSDDKIPETNIRPIWKDDDVFTIKVNVPKNAAGTVDENTKQIIRSAVKSRKDYKGSGNLTFFTTEDTLTDMLLMEDKMGRVIYDTEAKLATAMRVSKIVTAPILENLSYTDDEGKTHTLIGLMVNLNDYNVGTDRKGEPTMFEDFDIDYNAQKYLIETRKSGAMVKPYAAIALEYVTEGT